MSPQTTRPAHPGRQADRTPKPAGFTLIELLVVISIISLLIAILLPALSKARVSAQKIQCGSNMRQLGIVIYSYAQDFEGYMPGSNSNGVGFNPTATSGNSSGWAAGNWARDAKFYLGAPDATTAAQVHKETGMLQCPTTFIMNNKLSYGMNHFAVGRATVAEWKFSRETPRKLTGSVISQYSSEFLIAGESIFATQIKTNSWVSVGALGNVATLFGGVYSSNYYEPRAHLAAVNQLLADGHVEAQPADGKRFVINLGNPLQPSYANKVQWGRDDYDADFRNR